jgi:hypothetical protein
VEQHAQHIRAALPDHAEQILTDPAWPTLAAALTQAETAGHDPRQLLQHAARQRALDDARSTARTLAWRIQRLGTRPAPSEEARAAQARSAPGSRERHRHIHQRHPPRPRRPPHNRPPAR